MSIRGLKASLAMLMLAAMALPVCGCERKASSLSAGKVTSAITIPGHSTGQSKPVFSLADVIYTKADSVRVRKLLAMPVGNNNDVLFYARHFLGIPYVAHTLEVADPERLVVNLQQMDCTTLVETVLALTLTKRQGADSFEAFCRNLMRLRYRNGVMNGYLSRLHYFTMWMQDAEKKGLLIDVCQGRPHATAPITVNNYYMSRHANAYSILRAHPEWVDSIRSLEMASNGPDGHYIPAHFTALHRNQLTEVRDGDVIAIVTTKNGLDYSHLGFAVWGRDGKLHLLNASMLYKQVVKDKQPLVDYLKCHPSSVGIRPLRLR